MGARQQAAEVRFVPVFQREGEIQAVLDDVSEDKDAQDSAIRDIPREGKRGRVGKVEMTEHEGK